MSDKKQSGAGSAEPLRGRAKASTNLTAVAKFAPAAGVVPPTEPESPEPAAAEPVAPAMPAVDHVPETAEPVIAEAGSPVAAPAGVEPVEMETAVRGPVAAAAAPDAAPPDDVPFAAAVPPLVEMPKLVTEERIMTTTEELVSFQQANFEAMIKSGQIWAAGVQDIGRQVAATMQAQMEETVGAVKAMSTAKSLREAVELQSSLARSSVEKVVAEGSKLTDASMKLAEQAWAPITARLTTAADRFSRAA